MQRITPTCVGNTLAGRYIRFETQDHPHLRGEYWLWFWLGLSFRGSPPLAWGILADVADVFTHVGITPTCVGNTTFVFDRYPEVEDHPHLRGEYYLLCTDISSGVGSPPLAWGILTSTVSLGDKLRITPTCVGNTSLR